MLFLFLVAELVVGSFTHAHLFLNFQHFHSIALLILPSVVGGAGGVTFYQGESVVQNSFFDLLNCLRSVEYVAYSGEGCACTRCEFRNIERPVNYSIGCGCRIVVLRSGGGVLSARHSVDGIVINEDGEVQVSSCGVNQMVSSDCGAVAVTRNNYYVKLWLCYFDSRGKGDSSSVGGMD